MSDLFHLLKNQWDRAAAIGLVVLAGVLFLLGWMGISDAVLATQQIPYLASGGLFGLMALGVGATLWLSADLRDEWRKLDEISTQLGEAVTALNAADGSRGRAAHASPVRSVYDADTPEVTDRTTRRTGASSRA